MTEELRASKITIEIPKVDSDPWVHLTVNKMFYDDNMELVNNVPRFKYLSKPMSEIATNTYAFFDPVLQKEVTISGYGIAMAITSYVDDELAVLK